VLRRVYFYHQQWPVFYEDNHVLALYKPAGLVVQRDYKNKANLLDLAKAWLKVRHAKPERSSLAWCTVWMARWPG
jgi:23S rRNA-/tRNA-specific pseudouridylate synthase